MLPFNARKALIECVPNPLGPSFKAKAGDGYVRTLPHTTCAWNKGYYFQVVLKEYDFSSSLPAHRHKQCVCFPAPHSGKVHRVKNLLGEEYDLPVFLFYIDVNRSLFPAQQENQPVDEWAMFLPTRCRGIAHELLIAQQYADHYDYFNRRMPHQVTPPSAADEDKLMCPQDVIEQLLWTTEEIHGSPLQTVEQFKLSLTTRSADFYFKLWLKEHAVEKDCVSQMTIDYLGLGFRPAYRDILTRMLAQFGLPFAIKSIIEPVFRTLFSSENPNYRAFLAAFRNIYREIEEATLLYVLRKILKVSNA